MHDRSSFAAPGSGDQAGIDAAAPAAEQIQYFHAPHFHRPSPGPGFLMGVLGLGLIFLGGCFMIGLLAVFGSSQMPWTGAGIYIYVLTLYLFAISCFCGAAFMLRLGVRSLLKAEAGVGGGGGPGGSVAGGGGADGGGGGSGGANIAHRTSNVQHRSPEAEPEAGAAWSAEAVQVEDVHAAHHERPGVLPGLVLGGLGLGLVVPGACFTFGSVMLRLNAEADWQRPGTWVLLSAIVTLAALCYLGAAILLGLAAKVLLRAARG